jgi:drug/metabolite transporter superfamily protein YnfA
MLNFSGEAIENHDTLDDLVGENRAQYEKTLLERLEKRKQHLVQGRFIVTVCPSLATTSHNLFGRKFMLYFGVC